MASEPSETPMRDWMDDHPWSSLYLCVVVTAILLLQVLEATGVVK